MLDLECLNALITRTCISDEPETQKRWIQIFRMSSISRSQSFVYLNVGGKSFKVLRTTLQRFPESFLDILCQEFPELVEKGDELYVDRSPKYFEWILEVYRFQLMDLEF